LDLREILRRVREENVTLIQEEVPVQFDNGQQTPLGFRWRGRHYEVLEPLLVRRTREGHLGYLVRTTGGIFNLVLVREREGACLCRSKWVLKYRVGDAPRPEDRGSPVREGKKPPATGPALPEGRTPPVPVEGAGPAAVVLPLVVATAMVVPVELANVAHYHGHLCPELVVGYRAALIAREELGLTRQNAHRFFVLAENMSSAVDAVQYLTGCTVGNQSFCAYDQGKHVYYFAEAREGEEPWPALRVALVGGLLCGACHEETARRMAAGEADPEEVRAYRETVNRAVQALLEAPDEELFRKTRVQLHRLPRPLPRDYVRCRGCGEVVAQAKAVPGDEGFWCQSCAAREV